MPLQMGELLWRARLGGAPGEALQPGAQEDPGDACSTTCALPGGSARQFGLVTSDCADNGVEEPQLVARLARLRPQLGDQLKCAAYHILAGEPPLGNGITFSKLNGVNHSKRPYAAYRRPLGYSWLSWSSDTDSSRR